MTAVLGRGGVVGTERGPHPVVAHPPTSAPSRMERSSPSRGSPGGSPGPWRRLWIVPAVVVLAGALALLPTVGGDGPGPGEAEVRVDGEAVVVRSGGEAQVVAGGAVRFGPGDLIEVTAGRAHFALDREVTFEGRAGPAIDGRSGTTVVMGATPELVAGSLLVEAPVPTVVRAAGSQVTVEPVAGPGVARLDRRLGLGVGTYRGAVEVDSAGRTAAVAPLRRMEVARPGALERRDLALQYEADDPWDRRLLADALLVDGQLGPLLDAFDAVAGTAPASASMLLRARPGLPRSDLGGLVGVAPTASAALVTAVLADLGRVGSFPTRVQAIGRFRDGGARWGLVAVDQAVGPDALMAGIRAALDRLGPTGMVTTAAPGAADAGRPDGAGAATGPPSTAPAGNGAPPEEAPVAGPGPGGDGMAGSGGSDEASPGPAPAPEPAPPAPLPPALPPSPAQAATSGLGETIEGAGQAVGDLAGEVASGLEDVVDGLLGAAGRVLGSDVVDRPVGGGLVGLGGR